MSSNILNRLLDHYLIQKYTKNLKQRHPFAIENIKTLNFE